MAVQFFWDAKKISLSKVSRFGFSFSLWRVYFYQKYNYTLCNGGELAGINLPRNNFSSHSDNARSFFKKKNGMEKKRINFCLPCIVILANVSSEGNDHW